MKILLVAAPYRDIYGPIKKAAGNYFPLGLGYLAAVSREKGYQVKIVDLEAAPLSSHQLDNLIRDYKPNITGISCATPNYSNAISIARIAKKNSVFTVLGGVHASALPEKILEEETVFDVICVGEGEKTWLEICEHIQRQKSLEDILGIVYKKDGQIKRNKRRPYICQLDTIPLPARDLVNMTSYFPHSHNYRKGKTASIITSRGCPASCTFCASYLTTGSIFRPHSPKYVINEIEHIIKKYGIRNFLIQDDTFTVDYDRTAKICNLILSKKLNINWFCFARADTVDKALLRLMKKAGCYSIGYGVETAEENILKTLKKGLDLEQCRNAIKLTNKIGLKTQAFFIFGLPNETKESIKKTVDFALETSPALAFFNILVPYPGTYLFKKHVNLSKEINWRDFVAIGLQPVQPISELTTHELQKAVRDANIKFYFRLKQILIILKHISSFSEFLEYTKGAFALLLQIKGWHKESKRGSK